MKKYDELKNPPINEVVCGVRFNPIHGLSAAYLGALWSRFRDLYPCTEQKPPLVLPGEQLEIPVGESGVPTRVWFTTEEGTRLIQVQYDGFFHNWRRKRPDNEYPRFEAVYQAFCGHLDLFAEFVEEEELESIIPRLYELTYIDILEAGDRPIEAAMEFYFPHFKWNTLLDGVGTVDGLSEQLILTLPDGCGKLQIRVDTAVSADDDMRVLRLDMTARGPSDDRDAWFNNAHDTILESFYRMTGDEAKALWSGV